MLIKEQIFEKIKTIIARHDPLKILTKGQSPDLYDEEVEGVALFMADKSNIVNKDTIARRVLFVFKNSFTKETAKDADYLLNRISTDIFERVKIK